MRKMGRKAFGLSIAGSESGDHGDFAGHFCVAKEKGDRPNDFARKSLSHGKRAFCVTSPAEARDVVHRADSEPEQAECDDEFDHRAHAGSFGKAHPRIEEGADADRKSGPERCTACDPECACDFEVQAQKSACDHAYMSASRSTGAEA